MIRVLVKVKICEILIVRDCECNEACKIDTYLLLKIFHVKKNLFDKLVLAYEDEILNKTETSHVKKKVHVRKISI